jgi:hypothetical protein
MLMTAAIRATEEAIVRLLKAGHPLSSAVIHRDEEVRLPVFQAIEPVAVKDYGIDSPARVVVARARKEVWAVDIKRRGAPVSAADAQAFLDVLGKVRVKHDTQEVTGWMIATSDFAADAVNLLLGARCLYTARAALR